MVVRQLATTKVTKMVTTAVVTVTLRGKSTIVITGKTEFRGNVTNEVTVVVQGSANLPGPKLQCLRMAAISGLLLTSLPAVRRVNPGLTLRVKNPPPIQPNL